jgi:predicted secreted hydrolase
MNGRAMTNSMPMTWARRLTLAIGVPLAITLIGWTGFSVVALAGQGSYQVSYPLYRIQGAQSSSPRTSTART